MASYAKVSDLLGKIILKIDKPNDEELYFYTSDGLVYKMYHQQDCCEHVYLAEIIGDLEDLLGSVILMAEEVTELGGDRDNFESITWTFYKFATNQGYVTLRWHGESNGYYSESVDLVLLEKGEYPSGVNTQN